MIELGDAPKPPSKEELLAKLTPALKLVIESDIDSDTDAEKVYQYQNARKNYLMYRGLQFLAPVMRDGIADFASVGSGYGSGNGEGCYAYQQNIFRGYGRKFIAVMGQRAPNVKAMADDPEDEKSVRATRSADEANAILNSWWDVDERNIEASLKVWAIGPAFIYTPWNADGLMYGYREEPKYETSQQPMGESHFHCLQCGADSPQAGPCPKCGYELGPQDEVAPESVDVPQVAGTTKYPNGRVECHVADAFTVTIPFYTTRLETCPWLRYEYEMPKSQLISKFPELRGANLDSDASGQSAQGQAARESVTSPTGAPLSSSRNKNRWLFTRIWMQAWQYASVADDGIRQVLEQNYPTGLKITRVQGKIVALEEEKLDQLWSVIKPEAGETINTDPLGQDMVSAQLLKNDMLNIAAETMERGIPVTMVDSRVIDAEQWGKRQAMPSEVIPTLPPPGGSMGESFYQLPASRFSDQMMPFMQGVEQDARSGVGVVDEIFGGGNAPTARQAEINKNAAMMGLGTSWTYFRKGWEKAKRNGVMQLVKYGSGTIREGSRMVDLNELTAGGWHFEADEAIPATWGQMRDMLLFMMEKPPEILDAFGFTRPENIETNAALLGLPGYYIPGLEDKDKTQDTIQKLLQGQPTQQPKPDGSTDTQPSIPADEFEDNHQMVVQLVQGWAQSQPGRTAREQNPNGYSNVIAWGLAHQKMAQPPPPPPPPVVPKVSVAVSSKDLAPNQTQAILKDANLDVPPPPPPLGIPGAPIQPMPGQGAQAAPPATAVQ